MLYMGENAYSAHSGIPTGITPTGTIDITQAGDTDVTAYAVAHVDAGTEGTPTATKGAVSNHSVTITPSVTNSEGYIEGGTKTGAGVTVSASELVSGSETKTENGTYDVTNLAALIVNVSGGGGTVKTATVTPSSAANNISFTGLSARPIAFFVGIERDDWTMSTNSGVVIYVTYDGNTTRGFYVSRGGSFASAEFYFDETHYSFSYSNGTLTVRNSGTSAQTYGYFQPYTYRLIYAY